MALRLSRRHRKECEAGRPEGSKSRRFQEGRRGWRRCSCLIHASGSITGKFGRRSTGEEDWVKARAVAAGGLPARYWLSDEPPVEPESSPSHECEGRFTIRREEGRIRSQADAVEASSGSL